MALCTADIHVHFVIQLQGTKLWQMPSTCLGDQPPLRRLSFCFFIFKGLRQEFVEGKTRLSTSLWRLESHGDPPATQESTRGPFPSRTTLELLYSLNYSIYPNHPNDRISSIDSASLGLPDFTNLPIYPILSPFIDAQMCQEAI